MMQHLPDISRPMTDIERFIREVKPESPEELPQPVQVPGFRDPNHPRIPATIRQAALRQAQRQFCKNRRAK